MSSIKQRENLLIAEKKASNLFLQIEKRGLIVPGKYERDLNLFHIYQEQLILFFQFVKIDLMLFFQQLINFLFV